MNRPESPLPTRLGAAPLALRSGGPPAAPPPEADLWRDWQPGPLSYVVAALSFVLSLFTTTTLGAGWYLLTRTDVSTDIHFWLVGPRTVGLVWTDPALLRIGFSFSIPLLFILLCHEMGHYLVCRLHRVPASLPVFLPAPIGLGTFGAFIRIRAPIQNKRLLFDIGAGGPIAGFLALLPILLVGIARSTPATLHPATDPSTATALLYMPGKCLATELATLLFHGKLSPGEILDPHPFALAAWVGLLATALNLIPLGQLDGGHILYSVAGRRQQLIAIPLWLALAFAGIRLWPGWILWCVIVLIMRLRHPPVVDERVTLDSQRIWLALLTLVLLVLSFMPVPVSELLVTQ